MQGFLIFYYNSLAFIFKNLSQTFFIQKNINSDRLLINNFHSNYKNFIYPVKSSPDLQCGITIEQQHLHPTHLLRVLPH